MKKNSVLFALIILTFSTFALAENTLKLDIATQKGKGTVLIQLMPEVAPEHVKRIKKLVAEGAYDNIAFHRVINGFMAQTGDPTGTGAGGFVQRISVTIRRGLRC